VAFIRRKRSSGSKRGGPALELAPPIREDTEVGAGYFAPPRSPHRSRRSLDLALLLALQSDNSSAKKPACPSPPPTDPSSAHDPTVTVSMGLHTANHPAHTAGSEAGEVSGSSPPSGWFAGAGGVGSGSPLRGARKSSEDIRASPRKPLPLTFASGPAPAGVSTSTPPHGAIAGSAEAQMAHRGSLHALKLATPRRLLDPGEPAQVGKRGVGVG